jgi:TRAP-type uncharacterized transport system fused permease subunit
VTSFAAANIAGAEPMATGIEGFKVGLAGFLVPFAFVFQPALLLQGSFAEIIVSLALTTIGVVSLAAGVIGYLLAPLNALQRALLLCAAGLLVFSAQTIEVVGLAIVVGVCAWSFIDRRAAGVRRVAADPQS